MRFRAPTLEAAIALAETSLGARVRVVAANRIRRGGIGGFFASDLGVEVTVALDDETMEQALERLVAESTTTSLPAPAAGSAAEAAADERAQFESRLAQQLGKMNATASTASTASTVPAAPVATPRPAVGIGSRFDQRDDAPAPTVNPVLSEVLAALMAEAADQQVRDRDVTAPVPATVTASLSPASPSPSTGVNATGAAATADNAAAAESARDRAIAEELAAAFAAAGRSAAPESSESSESSESPETPGSPAPVAASAAPASTPRPAPTRIVSPDTTISRRPVYDTPPTMMRVEQIIEELSAITAAPVFGGDRSRGRVARPSAVQPPEPGIEQTGDELVDTGTVGRQVEPVLPPAPSTRPKVLPTLPPRAGDIARAASAASSAHHGRALASPSGIVMPSRPPAAAFAGAMTASPAPASPWPGRRPIPGLAPQVGPLVAPPAAPRGAVIPDSHGPGVGSVDGVDGDGHDEQAEMARMAESVRQALRGDADRGLVPTVDRDRADGVVHASLDIDADALRSSPAPAVVEFADLIDELDEIDGVDEHRRSDGDRHEGEDDREAGSRSPSRHQVELALAATDQLIESLKRDEGVKRLSVRVVLRTGDRREVEAEAEWESS